MPLVRMLAMIISAAAGLGSPRMALAAAAANVPSTPAPECKAGTQTLFFSPHPLLETRTAPGFADSLRRQLAAPMNELGYCLIEARDYRAILDTLRYGDNLILQPLAEEAAGGHGGSGSLLVALLRVRDLARGKLAEAVSRPLVAIRFGSDEVGSLPNILAKKVSENMRGQYVADVLIRSHPSGARVSTPTGLEGQTPVEWVMPLGSVPVTLEKAGYLPLRRDIDPASAGVHTYDLQLVKKRFYHSRFFIPALAGGVVALASFYLEDHYYSRYQALGPADKRDRPQAFADDFHTAKTFERLGYSALGLAWLNLALCFNF
jgi:hypothetical protein